MEITCPDCKFTKNVPSDVLSKQAVIANCPRCGCRFRFSVESGTTEKLARKVEDDPLPTGAIVIPQEETSETSGRSSGDTSPETVSVPSETEGKNRETSAEKDVRKEEQRSVTDTRDTETRAEASDAAAPHVQDYHADHAEQRFLREFSRQSARNPWDRAPGRIGWIASFYQTCLRIMFAAPRFFSSLSVRAPFYMALIFYVIICAGELLVNSVWMMILRGTIADSSDPQLMALMSMLAPQGNVLLTIFLQTALSVFKLYVLSALFFCIFQLIDPKKNSFTLIYQVVAYSTAPSLLCIVPLAGSLAGFVWSIACLAIGLHTSLRVSWLQTAVAFLPILFLFVVSMRYLATLGQM